MPNSILVFDSRSRTHGTNDNAIFEIAPHLRLNDDAEYMIALSKLNMYYGWSNISMSKNNHILRYSTDSGSTFNSLTFEDGNYTIAQINDVIAETVGASNIVFTGIEQTQKIKLTLAASHQVHFDPINGNIALLFGFNNDQIVTADKVSENKAAFASVESVFVNCDLVDSRSSFKDGRPSNVIYATSSPKYPYGSLYNWVDNGNLFYLPMNRKELSTIRLWLTDQHGKKLSDFEDSPVTYALLIKEIR